MSPEGESEEKKVSHVLLMGKPTRITAKSVMVVPSRELTDEDREAHYENLKKKVLDDLLQRWRGQLAENCPVRTWNSPHLPTPDNEHEIEAFIRSVLASKLNAPGAAYTSEFIRMGPQWSYFLFLAILVHANARDKPSRQKRWWQFWK